jgi:hypothetical protein
LDTLTFFISFFVLFGVTAAEIILAARWNSSFFRSGLIVFRQRVSIPSASMIVPPVSTLDDALNSYCLPGILFQKLSPGELAFREKLIGLHLLGYTPIMHGHVEARPEERVILVNGRLNWSTLAFLLVFSLPMVSHSWAAFLPVVISVIGLIYGLQLFRYHQVTQTLGNSLTGGCTRWLPGQVRAPRDE